MDPKTPLTNSDVLMCYRTYMDLLWEEDPDGPETVNLSFGYADVCHDGDVVAWDEVIINVADLEIESIPDDDEPYVAQTAHTPEGEE
jgi:hypothetical protein